MTDDATPPPRREADTADTELLGLADPYALDAVPTGEERAIAARLMVADPKTRNAFHNLTRDVRETMALLSAAYRTAPPPELRTRILDAVDGIPQDPPTVAKSAKEGKSRTLRWLFVAAAGFAAIAVSGFVMSQLPGHLESKSPTGHSRLFDVA